MAISTCILYFLNDCSRIFAKHLPLREKQTTKLCNQQYLSDGNTYLGEDSTPSFFLLMCSCLSKLVLDLSFKFSVHMEDNARIIPENGSNIVLKKTYCYKVSTQNGFDLLVFEWLAIDFPTKNSLK